MPAGGGSARLPGMPGRRDAQTRTVPAMPENPSLSADERAELERLRAENAALRAQVGQEGAAARDTEPAPEAVRVARKRWRTIVATLLIVVACVLAPLSVAAIWARNQVTNTDRYVATVTPLAQDPAIQQAITDQITAQVFTYIDIQALTTQVVDALSTRVEGRGLPPQAAGALQGLAGPVANGVQGFVRTQVERIVQSQAFEDAWIQANRVAHEALVKALTGEGGGAVTVENDTVTLNLGPFIQTVKQRLVAQGFTLAERIPQVDKSFVLFQSQDITRARSAFNLLNTLGNWLPVVALVLLAIGIYVAADHRRALVAAALGVAAGMVLLALGLAVFRSVYLDSVPATVLPHDAGAILSGESVTAVRTRQGLTGAIGWLAGGAERAGLRTGPVGTWVGANKRALRVAAVAAAALALVFWGRPTGKVVLGLTLALLAVLAVIELLARPARVVAGP